MWSAFVWLRVIACHCVAPNGSKWLLTSESSSGVTFRLTNKLFTFVPRPVLKVESWTRQTRRTPPTELPMAAVASPHEAERPNAEAAREVSAKMTKARCKAMVRELLSAYAAKSFQTKLTEILNKEVENKTVITDELAARWAWAENVHNDILAQYGFATGHGMEYLTLPLELILKSCPECMANVQKISEFLKLKTWPLQKSTETEKEEAKAAPQGLVAGRELSKPRALALQTELLAILSTPSFQKKLAEMSRKKLPHDTLHEYNRVSWLHEGQTV